MVENLPAKSGNVVWIPETRKSPGEGNGNPLQYSCRENPMDREEPGRPQAAVHSSHRKVRLDLATEQQHKEKPTDFG